MSENALLGVLAIFLMSHYSKESLQATTLGFHKAVEARKKVFKERLKLGILSFVYKLFHHIHSIPCTVIPRKSRHQRSKPNMENAAAMQGQGVDCSSEESNQRVDAEIRYNLCPLVYVKATVTIYQSNPDAFMRREKGDQAHQVRQSLVLAVAGVASGARSRLRRR